MTDWLHDWLTAWLTDYSRLFFSSFIFSLLLVTNVKFSIEIPYLKTTQFLTMNSPSTFYIFSWGSLWLFCDTDLSVTCTTRSRLPSDLCNKKQTDFSVNCTTRTRLLSDVYNRKQTSRWIIPQEAGRLLSGLHLSRLHYKKQDFSAVLATRSWPLKKLHIKGAQLLARVLRKMIATPTPNQ